jgi:hypothetical protein
MGKPPPSVRTLRLVPTVARSVRFLWTFSLRGGPWPWRHPSRAIPVHPFQDIVGYQAALPQHQEDASRRQLLETAMGGTTGADIHLGQCLPLAALAEHEENGIHRLPILDSGPMAPQGVWCAQRVFSWSSATRVAPVRESFPLQETIKIAYWDTLLIVWLAATSGVRPFLWPCRLKPCNIKSSPVV